MIPEATAYLPEMLAFIHELKNAIHNGKLTGWETFVPKVRAWYTPERLKKIDAIVMGWEKMSSYADEQTLIHLNAALVSLFGLPEYQQLSPEQQTIAQWIVLYHDVAKEPQAGQRDHTHGFRSAGVCGMGLVRQGFVTEVNAQAFKQWYDLTQNAIVHDPRLNHDVQDNRKLGEIMDGIDKIFGGRNSPTGLIISGVLLHMSVDVVADFPQAAPLNDDQIQAHISRELMPLLEVMMLTDNSAWALFEPERKQTDCESTRRVFEHVDSLLP